MKEFHFTGEYECKLDAKGRLKLPAALIKQLGGGIDFKFTINRGFEKHLMLYPNEVWEQKTKQIDQLNIYSTKQRQAIRFFYRGATELTMDSSERINLPASLMEYAGITQDVMLFAYQNHIEVWSKESYAASLDIESVDFDAIADVLGNLG